MCVFRHQPDLGIIEFFGIERDASPGPQRALVYLRGVTEDADRFGEGFRFKEYLVAIPRTTDETKCFVAPNGHLAQFFPGEIEDEDAMNHAFHVGNVDGVSNHEPIAYGRIGLGNHIDPIVFPILPKTDFHDLPVRRVAVCDGQNFVVQETQP